MSLESLCREIIETGRKAPKRPWVLGQWNIFDEDRDAQKNGLPYWTLVDGFEVIATGPYGRKSINTDSVVRGTGYDCDGLDADSEYLLIAANNAEKLARAVFVLHSALKKSLVSVGVKHIEQALAEVEKLMETKL